MITKDKMKKLIFFFKKRISVRIKNLAAKAGHWNY